MASPSLRGSGLKSPIMIGYNIFSRVSLFTREWIEMARVRQPRTPHRSPSLRGSGLKSAVATPLAVAATSPSLRGSGLKSAKVIDFSGKGQSPSLRGSGLKFRRCARNQPHLRSPSLRGSGLKSAVVTAGRLVSAVSLFTREWIEMMPKPLTRAQEFCLPLYEGVD